jgi:23S rRNA-/tRNA-specific pseudouridylate synthase
LVRLLRAESNGLLAIAKPVNLQCVPPSLSGKARAKLIVDAPYDESQECFHVGDVAPEKKLYLLHRLDSGTSGVLLLSVYKETAARVKKLFKSRLVTKDYRALVFCPTGWKAPSDREDWRDELPWREKVVQAQTSLRSAQRLEPSMALLSVRPRTGFTHQLRLQCARRNLPIVGDSAHGDFERNKRFAGPKRRLFLHAERIALQLPDGPPLSFHAPLPPEFRLEHFSTP